jgi:hypothetical protein
MTVTGLAKKLVFRAGEAFLLIEAQTTTSYLIPLRYLEHKQDEACTELPNSAAEANTRQQKTLV